MSAPPILSFRPESNSPVTVDLAQLVGSRALIAANSGGGKSWLARYMIEQTYGRIQHLIIDWEGEFSSLRERFDYVLVGAGDDADVPADAKSARVLMRRLLELNASAIVDLYDLPLQARRHYVRVLLESLMSVPKSLYRPLLVVIDEAQMLAPEGGKSEAAEAVIAVSTQGRKRGFCPIVCTQRLSKLDKDVSATLRNRFFGMTGEDLDIKRVGDILGFDKDGRATLPLLNPGEFYAFGPAVSRQIVLVRSGPVTTTHPKPGEIAPPAPPPPAAVRKMLEQMQGLERESEEEARTIEDLQRQLAAAKQQIRKLERGAPAAAPVVDDRAIARAVAAAESKLREEFKQSQQYDRTVERQLRTLAADLGKRLERIGKLTAQATELAGIAVPEIASATPPQIQTENRPSAAPVAQRVARATPRAAAPSTNGALPRGEVAVLTAACQYPDDGVTREQVTILTGYKRSTRDAYIQRLREKGLVEARGDRVFPTEGAEEHLGDFEPLPTGAALTQYWLDRLPAGEAAVLRAILPVIEEGEIASYVSRDLISERTGYKRSTRDAYIQRLSARQLVDISSEGVRPKALLFDGGAR
jgi:hypothetical protein